MNTILTNCNIYTMDEEKANASAIVNRNGIIYVGDDGDELNHICMKTQRYITLAENSDSGNHR